MLLFSDFGHSDASGTTGYQEVESIPTCVDIIGGHLDDYNAGLKTPVRLVIFDYALQHLCRIGRILRMPGGHALLVSAPLKSSVCGILRT